MTAPRARGHRAVPHTADVIVEAWGPTGVACFEEAVAGLVSTYADVPGTVAGDRLEVHVGPAADEAELLLALLDEVIYALDTAPGIPVAAEVAEAGEGRLAVTLVLAPPDRIEGTGAVPKAASRHDLEVSHGDDGVRCRFLVDV